MGVDYGHVRTRKSDTAGCGHDRPHYNCRDGAFSQYYFLSQSLGRLVRRYQGLCTFVSFLFLLWLAGKIAVGAGDLVFRFINLPNIPHTPIPQTAAMWQTTAFLLATEVLITVLYLAGTAYIYDTKLEL